MSRIDKLIADLCPDGVEFRTLGDILKIKNGKDHKMLGNGTIPAYGSGGILRNVDTAAAVGPSVLIPRKGSLGNIFYVEGPFWIVDTIFRTEIDTSKIYPKYLYHQLLTMRLGEMNQAGGVPSQTQKALSLLKVPVPPLEVQREIVRVLDKFTQLEAELEAELEARQRQYEHYLDRLVSLRGENETSWTPIGDLGLIFRGKRFTKSDYVDSGGIGVIHYGEIYTRYGTTANQAVSRVRSDLGPALRYARKGDVILTDVGETVEDVGKAMAWLGEEPVAVHDHCYVIRSELDASYLAYTMQGNDFRKAKEQAIARTKVKTLLLDGLKRIKVPIPPLEEQRRIVSILDKFDSLVNDLSVGLPAELEARRKQYEYYRDRLLTFEEKR